jgi:sodium-dependent dicarboxylate transporter 2/3/5
MKNGFNKPSILFILPGLLFYLFSIFIAPFLSINTPALLAISISILIINLWIAEIIPIWISSLIPFILLPIHNITSFSDLFKHYTNPIIFLFLGGFLLAFAVEKWELHKRFAFKLLLLTGNKPKQIIAGMLLTSFLLSMWISNTATTIMLLPIGLSISKLILNNGQTKELLNLSALLVLSISMGANIGGVATLIGTPPNIVYKGYVETILKQDISFTQWMVIGFPISIIMLIGTYFLCTQFLFKIKNKAIPHVTLLLNDSYNKLGKMTFPQKICLVVFSLAVFFWIFIEPINTILKTYSSSIKIQEYTIALFFSFILFLIPSKSKDSKQILIIADFKKINWSILLLFGAGISLAKGLESTGVIQTISLFIQSNNFTNLSLLSLILIGLALFLTEFMSNVALTQIIIPVIFGLAHSFPESHPHQLGIPVTIACSFAFMLPIGTPPNAVVYSSGLISLKKMIISGFFLNLLAVIILWISSQYFIPLFF